MEEKRKNDTIIMYGTPTCPMVPPMKALLSRTRATYDYIDIVQDLSARDTVKDINNGNESVPTFVFPDGSTLTEPSAGEMRDKLRQMGYEVPLTAMLAGNMWMLIIVFGVALALLRVFGIF